MRHVLLLVLLVAGVSNAQEVPVVLPEVPRGPDCDLPRPPMVEVPLRVEVDHFTPVPKGHVLLYVTGDVMLDGSCGNDRAMMGLERYVEKAWVEAVPLPNDQMDCGLSGTRWDRERVELDVAEWFGARIKRKDRKAPWRVVFRDVSGAPVYSQAFLL